MKKLLYLSGLSYLLIGLAHVVIGSVMPQLLDHYGRSYADGGSLVFTQFLGFLIGVLLSPKLSRLMGNRQALITALAVLCAAEAVYALLPSWLFLFPTGFAAGFGFGMVEALIGTIVISALNEQAGVAMTRIEAFFGFGALIMPIIAGGLILTGAWQLSFICVSAMSLLTLLWWAKGSFAELSSRQDQREENGQRQTAKVYEGKQRTILALFVGFFFLYVGLEMGFVNFLPSLFIEKLGINADSAAFSVTLFWTTMTIGRMFAGKWAEKWRYDRYLQVVSLGACLLFAGFAWTGSLSWAILAVLALGLTMSGIFAIALVYANRLLPGKTENTTSLLIASGGIGGAVIPLISGWSMDMWGAGNTPWLLSLAGAAMFGISVAASRMVRVQTA